MGANAQQKTSSATVQIRCVAQVWLYEVPLDSETFIIIIA